MHVNIKYHRWGGGVSTKIGGTLCKTKMDLAWLLFNNQLQYNEINSCRFLVHKAPKGTNGSKLSGMREFVW